MSEKLIRFCWTEAVADKRRIRYSDGKEPVAVHVISDRWLILKWRKDGLASAYEHGNTDVLLRLVAPPPRVVRLQLYRWKDGKTCAFEVNDRIEQHRGALTPIGEPFEREVSGE